jgi:hypothetical protein
LFKHDNTEPLSNFIL